MAWLPTQPTLAICAASPRARNAHINKRDRQHEDSKHTHTHTLAKTGVSFPHQTLQRKTSSARPAASTCLRHTAFCKTHFASTLLLAQEHAQMTHPALVCVCFSWDSVAAARPLCNNGSRQPTHSRRNDACPGAPPHGELLPNPSSVRRRPSTRGPWAPCPRRRVLQFAQAALHDLHQRTFLS